MAIRRLLVLLALLVPAILGQDPGAAWAGDGALRLAQAAEERGRGQSPAPLVVPGRKPVLAPQPPAAALPDGILPGPGRPFAYFAENERLAEVLAAFGRSMGVPIRIGNGVDGAFSGRLSAQTAEEFLDLLARDHGLVWFFDGAVLHVDPTNAVGSRTVQLEGATPAELRRALAGLGIPVDRFGWRQLPSGRMVIVNGPPRLLELVEQTAAAIDHPPEVPKPLPPVIRVFSLTHALAEDRTLSVRGQRTVVPGVATILRNLLAGSFAGTMESGRQRQIARPLERLRGSGLAAGERPSEAAPSMVQAVTALPTAEAPAIIQSDSRLNAVIIRDAAERMDAYAEVIRILDVPVKLVEIEVSIIDVSVSKLEALGIDWRLQGSRGGIGYGAINSAQPDVGAISMFGGQPGETFSTILSSGATGFLARIRALQEHGDADILSRPSVLTIDNAEALLDHSETFYVRVAGRDEVDLFPVSVGILLKVTPHIMVASDGTRTIQLLVDIEDGSILDRTVDEIPSVQRSSISTQAIVAEYQSLLIGGVSRQSKLTSESGVPVLKEVPLVGNLFKSDSQEQRNVKRMFLITPKIVKQ